MNAIQLLALFIVFLLVLCQVRNNIVLAVSAFLLAVLFSAQASSLYLIDNFINLQYITHLNFRDLEIQVFQFVPQILMLVFVLLFTWALLWMGTIRIRRFVKARKLGSIGLVAVLVGLMSMPGGVARETYYLLDSLAVKNVAFEVALRNLGIEPESYPMPWEIHAKAGKNIIVISMESLERGFLENDLEELTPNLQKLSRQYTFYGDMPKMQGGNWTAASLYNHQVGMPAFFAGQSNALFQDTTDVSLVGIGHVLEQANYNSVYLMGNPDFAGSLDLLTAYKIPVVSQENTIGSYPATEAGLNDKDLFEEAKLQIRAFRSKKEPFAFFMSTINTHFPNGIYDKRMESVVGRKANPLESSVAALDYLVGDFIRFLSEEGLLENTALFIFPDHFLMGRGTETVRKINSGSRSLFLISNASEGKLKKSSTETIYQIELARMILDGAEIETNARFLSDFIGNRDVPAYLRKNRSELTALNHASVVRASFLGGFEITIDKDQVLVVSQDKEIYADVPQQDEILDITFTPQMNRISTTYFHASDALVAEKYDSEHNHIHLLFQVKGKEMLTYLGDKKQAGVYRSDEEAIVFSATDVAEILELLQSGPPQDAAKFRRATSLGEMARDTSRFIAHAGGAIAGRTYTNSKEALDQSYARGFRMFELDIIKTSDDWFVAAHDWKRWKRMTGYDGDVPPTRETFKSVKIRKKYTPMDIEDINAWFEAHPDAILVTDKTNFPLEFSSRFVDKSRLMMELFTVEALKEGLQSNIRAAMPTWAIVDQIQTDTALELKRIGVTAVAASRRVINHSPGKLSDLAANGIKVYAFHVNFDKGKDESYVVCNELGYFYGLYADNWDFNSPPNCPDPG